MPRKDKYYIAGPMTGIEGYNSAAFDKIAADLRSRGYEVVSPIEVARALPGTPGSLPYEVYAQESLKAMMECTAIVLIPRWGGSRGANLELQVAHHLKFKVYHYDGEDRQLRPDLKLGGSHVG